MKGFLPWIILILWMLVVNIGNDIKTKQISTLTRSHAVMEQRQKILTEITCGYCHHKVPDWCDKHAGVE